MLPDSVALGGLHVDHQVSVVPFLWHARGSRFFLSVNLFGFLGLRPRALRRALLGTPLAFKSLVRSSKI